MLILYSMYMFIIVYPYACKTIYIYKYVHIYIYTRNYYQHQTFFQFPGRRLDLVPKHVNSQPAVGKNWDCTRWIPTNVGSPASSQRRHGFHDLPHTYGGSKQRTVRALYTVQLAVLFEACVPETEQLSRREPYSEPWGIL